MKFFIGIKNTLFIIFRKIHLVSDVKNVVYLNWLVPVEKLDGIVPKEIKLKEHQGHVLFTILTYKHGHFRPKILRFLKFAFGSPIQSNWRFYIDYKAPENQKLGEVFFVRNILNSRIYTWGSRWMSYVLQAEYYKNTQHQQVSKNVHTSIQNQHSLEILLQTNCVKTERKELPPLFKSTFGNYATFLEKVCHHESAIAKVNGINRYCKGRINLDFNIDEIEPLILDKIRADGIKELIADSSCVAFQIPTLKFHSLGEELSKTSVF